MNNYENKKFNEELEEEERVFNSIVEYCKKDYSLIWKIKNKELFERVLYKITAEGEII